MSSTTVVNIQRPSTIPASPSTIPSSWTDLLCFAVVAVEFGMLVLIVRMFELESLRFGEVLTLAWVGFVIHHFLPAGLRLPFFALLSVASLKVGAGGTVAVCVTGVGLVLIGVCHLPVAFALRIGLLLLIGGLLAALRVGWLNSAITPAAWMILGSMFMFRVIIYLYDLRHRAAEFSLVRSMAYFFMLPNVCFPLFPLVDYKTFCTTYYNDAPLRIYQSGLSWILRGITHLLLYRVLYQFGLSDPLELTDLGGAVRFMLVTYLLYLRISGQFHIIVGLLHLFGFNLPETHHLYLLSSSFTDFWRRINIYWKDFIMKLFFYPAYFRLKRWGPTWALTGATLIAFFTTWMFHAYQWLWLRGSFLFSAQDIFFWWALAMLVLVNTLYEAKWGRQRSLARPRRTFWSEAGRALSTVATFVTICVLWTVWSCQGGEELFAVVSAASHVTPGSVALIVAVLAGLGLSAVLFGRSAAQRTEAVSRAGLGEAPFAWRSAWGLGLGATVLLLVGVFGPTVLHGTTYGEALASVLEDRLNQLDVEVLRRGYYEDLDVARRDEKLGLVGSERKQWWDYRIFRREKQAFMTRELVPTPQTLVLRDKPLTINRWGMRDRDYEMVKPPGVFRIALFGASTEMGHGVGDTETFENLLEDRLNREDAGGAAGKFEILNFSVGANSLYEKLWQVEHQAVDFQPDAVFFSVYVNEANPLLVHLTHVLRSGYEIPDEYGAVLHEVYESSGVSASLSANLIQARLRPYVPKLIGFAFQRLAEHCRARGVQAFLVYRPELFELPRLHAKPRQQLFNLAQQAGLPVLDLSNAYAAIKDKRTLEIAPYDDHTNVEGHSLLAAELYRQLHDSEGRLRLTKPPLAEVP